MKKNLSKSQGKGYRGETGITIKVLLVIASLGTKLLWSHPCINSVQPHSWHGMYIHSISAGMGFGFTWSVGNHGKNLMDSPIGSFVVTSLFYTQMAPQMLSPRSQ